MLSGIHIILTYQCNFQCDHCFLYSGPQAQGVFTITQIDQVLEQAVKIGTIEWIFIEGGEPFLFFPLLNESIKRASSKGFKVGVVTNAYGATTKEDAELWLKPLADSGLTFLHISNDTYHYGEAPENPATIALSAAKRLEIDASPICIEPPKVDYPESGEGSLGKPVVGGGAMFRGRAVDKLTGNLPCRPWRDLCKCPYEDLESPQRVHVDPFGNVQICQGISIGNMWMMSLADLISSYNSASHPICGPLVRGGPAQLSKELGVKPDEGYIDECHFCYVVRRGVLDNFDNHLAPKQVYGLD